MSTELEEWRQIAEMGDGEASGLIMAILHRNTMAAHSMQDSIVAGLERERDQWRERALTAETIKRMEDNVIAMLYRDTY